MKKDKIKILIPIALIGAILAYCWSIFLFTDVVAIFGHYVALILYLVPIYFFRKNLTWAVLSTGLYLLLATFTIAELTPTIYTYTEGVTFFQSFTITTPRFQPIGFWLLLLYLVLNYHPLIEIYLNYQDGKRQRKGKG